MESPCLGEEKLTRPQSSLDIAKQRFLFVWAAVGLLILLTVVVYVGTLLSTPLAVIVWSAIFVFCLRGPVAFFEKKGISRLVGTGLAFALMIVVFFLILLLMFSPVFGIGDQFISLVESIPGYIDTVIAWGNDLYDKYSSILSNDTVKSSIDSALSSIGTWASELATTSASGVVAVGSGIVNIFIAIGFGLLVAFWILLELPALGRETLRLAGPKYRETFEMFHLTVTRVIGGYIKGTLLQCTIIGVGSGIVFAVLGIPNFAALGVMSGLFNIIPILGPWLGAALAAIAGVFVSPLVAVLALIGAGVISEVVYTFVYPKIMADSVDIHPALIILALVFGSAIGSAISGLMGSLVGMLIAIPAVGVMKSVFVYYFEKHTRRHLVSEDGVFFQGARTQSGELDPLADATSPHPDSQAAAQRVERLRAKIEHRIKGKK